MPTHTTLVSLFNDIANSIRGKTGKSAAIIADNFPAEIDSIILGSGNATAADVLDGKTFSNDSGSSTGTMPNNGAISKTITTQNGTYTVPAGYHNGSGVVKATLSGGEITASGTQQQSAPTFSLAGNIVTAIVAATSGTISPSVTTAGYVSSTEGTKTPGTFTMSANSGTYTIQTETKTATVNGDVTPSSGKYLTKVTVALSEYNGEVS